jgi:uncharacterized protein (DUF3084 family)
MTWWDSPDTLHAWNMVFKYAAFALGLLATLCAFATITLEQRMRDLSTTADRELRQQLEKSRTESATAVADANSAKADAAAARTEATSARTDATAARADATLFREQLEGAQKRIAELSPRVLTPDQRRQIVASLRGVPSAQRRFVMVNGGDPRR